MQVGTAVDYRVDIVNTGSGIVTDYEANTGRMKVMDVDDGEQFVGYEDDVTVKEERYVTLTLRYEPGQSLPTDDRLLGSYGMADGEVVGVAYYNAQQCLHIALRALNNQGTSAAKRTVELINAMQAQGRL